MVPGDAVLEHVQAERVGSVVLAHETIECLTDDDAQKVRSLSLPQNRQLFLGISLHTAKK